MVNAVLLLRGSKAVLAIPTSILGHKPSFWCAIIILWPLLGDEPGRSSPSTFAVACCFAAPWSRRTCIAVWQSCPVFAVTSLQAVGYTSGADCFLCLCLSGCATVHRFPSCFCWFAMAQAAPAVLCSSDRHAGSYSTTDCFEAICSL